MDEKVKKEQIDYEVEESRPMEDEGNAGRGNADAGDCNMSAYYAIAAVLAVFLIVVIMIIFTNLK